MLNYDYAKLAGTFFKDIPAKKYEQYSIYKGGVIFGTRQIVLKTPIPKFYFSC